MIIDQTHQVRPGMTGESVTNLHRRLVLAGLTVPADELRDDRFGPGTVEAIRQFQIMHGLPPHGELDDLTAHGLGIATKLRAIAGVVCQPDGAPLANVAVRLHQAGASGKQVVAETRSGADGQFALPWPAGATGGLTLDADGAAEKPVSWKALPSSGPFWVRLSVGGVYRGASTFALLASALTPAVEDGAFHALARADRTVELAARWRRSRTHRSSMCWSRRCSSRAIRCVLPCRRRWRAISSLPSMSTARSSTCTRCASTTSPRGRSR
jgi:peptidoglycan hydrolase-like protein with peptidoglycan-binding domain